MKSFIAIYPIYGVVFTMGSLLAMFTTVLATLSFFYVSFILPKSIKFISISLEDVTTIVNDYMATEFAQEKIESSALAHRPIFWLWATSK